MSSRPFFACHLHSLFQRSPTLSHSHILQIHSLLLKVPPSPFQFNSLMRGYTRTHYPHSAFHIFLDLLRTATRPDNFTYPFVLKACTSSSMLREGTMVHGLVVKAGFLSDSFVGNTLLHLYASCRVIGCARKVFEEMGVRDVVSWSCMIEGCITCEQPLDALTMFRQMRIENVQPNSITLISLLSACHHLSNVSFGRAIHSYITTNNIKLDVALGTAIIGMYTKCGHVEEALQIFTSMEEKNLQSWMVMISGLADHGQGKQAISLMSQMEAEGLKPDSMLFSAILSACSHSGLVEEGQELFKLMINVYKVQPTIEHYGCMVDLLGRAGLVEAAYEFIRQMPVAPNSLILRSLLGASRKNGLFCDVDGKLMKMLTDEEPCLGANYVLAADVAALRGKWNDAAELRNSISEKGLRKVPGCTWVNVARWGVSALTDN